MAYNIIAHCPRYDDRDAVVGYSAQQYNDYSFETLTLARRVAQQHDQDCYGDVDFRVVDSSGKDVTYDTDPCPCAHYPSEDEDIPF
jgi:hypothetical protein